MIRVLHERQELSEPGFSCSLRRCLFSSFEGAVLTRRRRITTPLWFLSSLVQQLRDTLRETTPSFFVLVATTLLLHEAIHLLRNVSIRPRSLVRLFLTRFRHMIVLVRNLHRVVRRSVGGGLPLCGKHRMLGSPHAGSVHDFRAANTITP